MYILSNCTTNEPIIKITFINNLNQYKKKMNEQGIYSH